MLEKLNYRSKSQLLGEIVLLMTKSDLHLNYRIKDLVKNFLPPLDLDQFRIYKKNHQPIALITWAYLDDSTQEKYSNFDLQYDLQADDWNKGKNLWLIDFICIKNCLKEIENDLKHNLFANQVAQALRADSSGKIFQIQKYFGINFKNN